MPNHTLHVSAIQPLNSSPTCLSVCEDGDVVPPERRVQQLRHAAQLHHVRLPHLGAQAGVEGEVALHAGARGTGDHNLRGGRDWWKQNR